MQEAYDRAIETIKKDRQQRTRAAKKADDAKKKRAKRHNNYKESFRPQAKRPRAQVAPTMDDIIPPLVLGVLQEHMVSTDTFTYWKDVKFRAFFEVLQGLGFLVPPEETWPSQLGIPGQSWALPPQ
jgi:hypothetical protein